MFIDRIPVRYRLALGHAIWMALLFLAVGCGLYRIVEMNLYQSVDASLMGSAQSIRDARFVRGITPPIMEQFLNQVFGEKYIQPYAQLVDLSGKIRAKTAVNVSLPVTPKALARAERGLETFETFPPRKGEAPLRQVTLPVIRFGSFTGELIQVGATLDSTYHTLRQISWVLWIAFPVSLGLSIVFGYVLTKRSLKPVNDMSNAAATLSSDDLSMRIPLPRANDELRALATTFNDMLGRLEDAFMRLRRFTGDVSHELRTPLAVLKGEAQFALRRERPVEDYKTSLATIRGEAETMTKIIEDLLLLARAESRAVAMNWLEVNLNDFKEELVHTVLPVFEGKNVELIVDNSAGQKMFANHGYLALALKNILLNAAKHSPSDSKVDFRISREGTAIKFMIRDYGEGIPEKSLPYIFDPFYRADTARNRAAGGTGIGLSLALALVKLHNGTIAVTSRPGEGAEFIITIPAPPPSVLEELQASEIKSLDARPAVNKLRPAIISHPSIT